MRGIDLLDRVYELAESIDEDVSRETVDTPDGEQDYLLIQHGNYALNVEDKGDYVIIYYPATLNEEETERFHEKLTDKQINIILDALRETLLKGRSAFQFHHDDENQFFGFTVEQKFIPHERDGIARQRLADAIQELVVLGMGGSEVLGAVFQDDGPDTQPHPGMYG